MKDARLPQAPPQPLSRDRGFAEIRHPTLIAAVVFHATITLAVFSPAWLRGQAGIWSTDIEFTHVPYLVYGSRCADDGVPGLWWPHVQAGVNLTTSPLAGQFSPLNWPLLLVDESHLLTAFTARTALEFWLIGVFGFLFFRRELGRSDWALVCSSMLQIGQYTIWALTVYWSTGLALVTICLYVIWSLEDRRRCVSYLLISVLMGMLFIHCILPYAATGALTVLALSVYRYRSDALDLVGRRSTGRLLALAVISASLLAACRWYPSLAVVSKGKNPLQKRDVYRELHASISPLFGITAAVPEALGVDFSKGRDLVQPFGARTTHHTQTKGMHYFGGLTVALLLWGLVASRDRKVWFWAAVLALCYAFNTGLEPLRTMWWSSVPRFVLHASFFRGFMGFGACLLVGHAGLALSSRKRPIQWPHVVAILAVALAIAILVGAIWAGQYKWLKRWLMWGLIAVAGLFWLGLMIRIHARQYLKAYLATLASAFVLSPLLLLAASHELLTQRISQSPLFALTAHGLAVAVLAILWTVGAGLICYRLSLSKAKTTMLLCAGPVVGLAFQLTDYAHYPVATEGWGLLAMLGTYRFLLVVVAVLVLVGISTTSSHRSARWLPAVLLCLLLSDLLPFRAVYAHQITKPFVRPKNLYPGWLVEAPRESEILLRESFDARAVPEGDGWPGWKPGSSSADSPAPEVSPSQSGYAGPGALRLSAQSEAVGHYYYTLSPGKAAMGRSVSLAFWARCRTPGTVRGLLTSRRKQSFTAYHSGSGQWELLTARIQPLDHELDYLRVHLSIENRGVALVDSVTVRCDDAYRRPPGPLASPYLFGQGPLDMSRYRCNRVGQMLHLTANERQTCIFSIYGLRSYAGVHMPKHHGLLLLLDQVHPELAQIRSAGLPASASNERFLDLAGCRYDLGPEKSSIIERPNSLGRLMLFENWQVIPDVRQAAARVMAESFDPRRTVVLGADPSAEPTRRPAPARHVRFEEVTPSRIRVKLDSRHGGVLLFNDAFDPEWTAKVNGQDAQILRANAAFMAVAIPAGSCEVSLALRPDAFIAGLWIMAVGAAFTAVTAWILARA